MSSAVVAHSHHVSTLVVVLWGPVGLGIWVALSLFLNRGRR